MSSPSQPAGSCVERHDLRRRVGVERVGGDDVGRQDRLERERVLAAHVLGHLAADQHRVGPRAEVLEHADLVLDLGAAGDDHERPRDVAEQATEMLELVEQQEPGVGRQEVRHALGRGVRAVRRAERVVDVEVAAVGELACVRLVVRGLTRVEARVLEHVHAIVTDERPQRFGNRGDRVLLVLALRPPEVRADAHLGRAALEQQPKRRQRRADARVVGDPPVLERHVQIRPDEDDLAVDLCGLDGARQPQSSFETRSTSRHE